jgi:NAD-dependent dihydropyrimidine dehydrogenase PreA subunit/biotin operon repressor
MGHIVHSDREYRMLQKRLDRHITGAPESETFMKILRLLFTPEDARLARQIPTRPISLNGLARKLNMSREELGDRMTDMAERGLVIDIMFKRRRYFSLAPVVIGFFEFTFMRTRDELPMAELAQLFDRYMTEDDRFARSVFQGQTQLGRSLVREEALSAGDHTEILDWERASQIIQSATQAAVSLCACRHKAHHLGTACDRPQEVCLSLNFSADVLVRSGMAKPLTIDEAMQVLEVAKDAGLAQTGDNVQHKVGYICNCCGCCCAMMEAVKLFDMKHAIVTSNWLMEIDPAKCKGCGKCAAVCPLDVIEIVTEGEGTHKKKWAIRDETLCLGCGVCYSACKLGAITMKPRAQRVFTPETTFDRLVAMAIERGKLADLLFEDPRKLSHRALGRIVGVLEKTAPYRAVMAVKPLRSAFFNALVGGVGGMLK